MTVKREMCWQGFEQQLLFLLAHISQAEHTNSATSFHRVKAQT